MTTTGERRTTYTDVFRVGEYRTLFAVQMLRMIGMSVQVLALTVLVYARTESALMSAVTFGIGFVPQGIGGLLLNSIGERVPPRVLIAGYALVRAVMAVTLALTPLPVSVMLGLVFAVSLFAPVAMSGITALLPEILPGDRYVLGRSLFSITSSTTQIVGLALGGTLVAIVTPRGALLITATTALLVALVTRLGLHARPSRGHDGGSLVGNSWAANRRLLGDRRIRGVLLAMWLPVFCLVGAESLVVAYLGAAGFSARVTGPVLAALPVGMAVGEVVVGRAFRPATRDRLAFPLALLLTGPLLGFLARPGPAVAAALTLAAGCGIGYQLSMHARFVDVVPERSRGEAFALQSAGLMAGQGISAAAFGAATALVPIHVAMATAGALGLVAAAATGRTLLPPSR